MAQLVKNPPAMQKTDSVPGLGRSPREGKGNPVFWPREFHGLYSPWGCKELDTTEQLSLQGNRNGNFVLIFIRIKFCS